MGIPPHADVDALHVSETNLLYVSLDISATIGSFSARDEDLWCYAIPSGTLSHVIENTFLATRTDLEAVDEAVDSDDDGLTDYEEKTGNDEAAGTDPSTGNPLDPKGHITNPNDSDTDNDGFSDGEEAAACTDPNALNEYPGNILPTVTTLLVSDITDTTALGGGNVTTQGSHTVTLRGICWATTANPTSADTCATSGSDTGVFSNVTLSGLSAGTTYHVRAFASNAVGVAYGNDVSFQTLHTPPTVVTLSVSNKTTTSAVSGGNVTDGGTAAVTSRGICYGLNANPTPADTCITSGSGTGIFSGLVMSNLTAATTYHVRAFAINAGGTSYGSDVSFDTLSFDVAFDMRLSLDVAATLLNGGFVDEEVISVGTVAVGTLFNAATAGVPQSVEVDAAFVSGSDVVFSTDQDFEVDGNIYADEDLVAYSVTGATLSVYFDGSANGIPAEVDLDAASLEFNGSETNLLLSLDIATSLPGAGAVDDADLIRS